MALTSGRSGSSSWVERDVKLYDPLPSEKHLHYTVRALLWSMVELTTLRSSEDDDESDNYSTQVVAHPEEEEVRSLPKAFGSNKRRNNAELAEIGGFKRNAKKSKICSYNSTIEGQQNNNFFKASYINYMKRHHKSDVGCSSAHRLIELDSSFDGNVHLYSDNIFVAVLHNENGEQAYTVQVLGLADSQGEKVLVRSIGGLIGLQRMVMRRHDLLNAESYGGYHVSMLNLLLDRDVEESISLEKSPPNVLQKYFDQRYRLFRRYDEGILLDDESWYSVTPEAISQHIADYVLQLSGRRRLGGIIELFCGSGGNTIPLANISEFVVAIDHDVDKLTRLVNNAAVYGVAKCIFPIACDVHCLLEERSVLGGTPKFDLLLMSPPWGGPAYLEGGLFNLKTGFPCGDGFDLIVRSFRLCGNVVCVLPKNVDSKQLRKIQRILSGVSCRLERIFLHNKHKLSIFYVGAMFDSSKHVKCMSLV